MIEKLPDFQCLIHLNFRANSRPLIPQLQPYFNILEADRQQILEKISHLSNEQFHRALPGKWSVSQIVAHLITAERQSLRYMQKKILGISQVGNSGLWEEAKMIVLRWSQRLPLKFKAPRIVVENAPNYHDFDQLKADWDHSREELKQFLEGLSESHFKRKIYRHIRAGRLNVRHALIFFREHFIHHTPQIRRLL